MRSKLLTVAKFIFTLLTLSLFVISVDLNIKAEATPIDCGGVDCSQTVVVSGYVKSTKGNPIPNVGVRIVRDDGVYRDITTDSTGKFSLEKFIPKNRTYAVRLIGNISNPQTAPTGYKTPGKTTTDKWVWDFCANNRDIPVGSLSYECQSAGSGSSCADANPLGLSGRCNFAYEPVCKIYSQGDADCNEKINLIDFGLFFEDFLDFIKGEKRAFNHGDFDSDDKVNLVDFNTWQGSYAKSLKVTK